MLPAAGLIPPFAALPRPAVLHADRITARDLLCLAAGQAIAVVVRDYAAPRRCARVVARLLADRRYSEYENVPGVHKWGLNTYEGLSSPEREERYFADAIPAIQALRGVWAPDLSPLDRLRLELQESWPAGANLENLDGRSLFVGQARVFEKDNGAIPHQDFLPWELADLRGEATRRRDPLAAQLTANVYLQMPDTGGQLQLWSRGFDHEEYDALRMAAGSYGLDRARLPEPDVEITPEPGMLVLFHSTRAHAVLPSRGRPRVALSSFIGIRAIDRPLSYWS